MKRSNRFQQKQQKYIIINSKFPDTAHPQLKNHIYIEEMIENEHFGGCL